MVIKRAFDSQSDKLPPLEYNNDLPPPSRSTGTDNFRDGPERDRDARPPGRGKSDKADQDKERQQGQVRGYGTSVLGLETSSVSVAGRAGRLLGQSRILIFHVYLVYFLFLIRRQ